MKGVVRRFKQTMVFLLSCSIIMSSVIPVFAASVQKRDWSIIADVTDDGKKYTTGVFDADRTPYVSEDGSLILNRAVTGSYDNGFNVPLKNSSMDLAVDNFIRAMKFTEYAYVCKQLVAENRFASVTDATRKSSELIWDATFYTTDYYICYNPYGPYYWEDNDSLEDLSGQNLARAEFDNYLSDLKGIGWKEFSDAIDTVLDSFDFVSCYNSSSGKYVHSVVCPFVDAVFDELVSSGTIALSDSCSYKYTVEKFTYDSDVDTTLYTVANGYNILTSQPYDEYVRTKDNGRRSNFVVSEYVGYDGLNGTGRTYSKDSNFVPDEGFVSFQTWNKTFTATDRMSESGWTSFKTTRAFGFGPLSFVESSIGNATYPYYGYRTTDLENSRVVLIDVASVYPVTAPSATDGLISRAVVNDLQVGDILAPGALLVNSFDVEANQFNFGSVYSDAEAREDGKYELYHYLGEYVSGYGSSSGRLCTSASWSWSDVIDQYDSSTPLTVDVLPSASAVSLFYSKALNDAGPYYVKDSYGYTDSPFAIFTDVTLDLENHVLEYMGRDTDYDVNVSVKFHLTDNNTFTKEGDAFEVTVTSDEPVYPTYAKVIDTSLEYIRGFEGSVSGARGTVASLASLNSIVSYYATRMCVEEDVVGYQIVDIQTSDFTASSDDYYDWSMTGGEYYMDSDLSENNRNILIKVKPLTSLAPPEYTVWFESNGGSDVESQTVSENNCAIKPVDPVFTGHNFEGWYSDEDLLSDYDFDTPVVEDMTLYAKWSLKNYTVSFNSLGGTQVSPQTVSHNSVAKRPSDPVYTGHDFINWFFSEQAEDAYDFDTPVVDDMTLFARWERKDCTVTFNPVGGTPVSSQTVKYGEKITRPDDSIKTGHHIENWRVGSTAGEVYDFDTPVTGDIELFADWGKNSYTVTVNKGEGITLVSGAGTYLYGDNVELGYELLPGYDFNGWSGDESTDVFIMPANDVTVTANAVRKTYHVLYDGNGADYGAMSAQEKAHGIPITLKDNEFTREGFEFVGWNTRSDGHGQGYDEGAEYNGNGEVTMYAQWVQLGDLTYQKKLFNDSSYDFYWNNDLNTLKNVLYEPKDDLYAHSDDYWTAAMSIDEIDYDDAVAGYEEELPDAGAYPFCFAVDISLDKYISTDEALMDIVDSTHFRDLSSPMSITFDGSALVPDGCSFDVCNVYRIHKGVVSVLDSELNSDTNRVVFESDGFSTYLLYCGWSCNVKFESNGGSSVSSQTVDYGKSVVKPANPARAGFSFAGWYSDVDLLQLYDFGKPVFADMVLYAKWIPLCHVTFDADGGTPVPDEQVVEYGSLAVKPVKSPFKSDYVFANWYLGDVVYDFSKPVTSDIKLTAKYKRADVYYVVTFDSDGGDRTPAGQRVIEGGRVVRPFNPSKDDYTFEYWDYAGTKYDFNQPVYTDMVLTAVYKKKDKKKEEEKKRDSVVYQPQYQNPVIFMSGVGTGSVMVPSGSSQSVFMKYDTVQTGIAPIDFSEIFTKDD